MSKFIKLRQVWINKDKNLCYDKVIVNIEHISCLEPNCIRTTSYPKVLDSLNVGDRSNYEKVVDEIETVMITLTSGKEILVTDKFEDIEKLL